MTVTPGTNTTASSTHSFLPLPNFDLSYELRAKLFNQQGDIVYEYNPFHNLKDASTGGLKDFTTPVLNFNLNNPVDITVQPSYDGTVNLILNDDINPPRLINSRFTPIEDKRYEIVDRIGNNDTNIYDEQYLDEVTRLFLTTQKIPYITFQGLVEGGALKCGNYVFYFKYCDADGNESDIIAESGLISCYIGKLNDPFSTRGGIENEQTNKIAKLVLNNLDTAYDYVNVYFTRATSDYSESLIKQAYKVSTKKIVSGTSIPITITGLEDIEEIGIEELNIQYNIVDSVKTQAQVQNMLFFGNVNKPTIPYQDLQDLALRIYPTIANTNNIGYLDENYIPLPLVDDLSKSEYYDAVNVYNYTGYWNKEMYRLGVVFILKDDLLSPVFNIRGRDQLDLFTRAGTFVEDISELYTYTPLYDGSNQRQYINYNEEGLIPQSQYPIENSRGVVRITYNEDIINKDSNTGIYPISINFNIESDTITEMKKFVKGFFFVRQKRIPTIIAQGISIGVDNLSFIPTIKANITSTSNGGVSYITESFMDKTNQLVHDFSSRLLKSSAGTISVGGLLCPEATLLSSSFSEVFTGSLFNLSRASFVPTTSNFEQDPTKPSHFYINGYSNAGASNSLYKDVKLTLIEDDKPLAYSGTKRFSTRVGIPEEAYKFGWYGNQDTGRYATNLIRGAFGGFVGMENFSEETTMVDIHIPGYDQSVMSDYFSLRANSFHPFYAMSDRYDIDLLGSSVIPYDNINKESDNIAFTEYRGDCFINTYTTRILRNFSDPETPINDIIIDPFTWKTNYTGYTASGGLDSVSIAKINRGDVNAVKMGHWATFKICSNINLAYRPVDDSHTSELGLTGKSRSFYPYASMSVSGESKIPESGLINVGYNTTTSDKVYNVLPDVPYIKNIFDNRIMYSEIHINDAFRNGYRIFQGLDYKDITRQYGAIVKMFEKNGNLLIVFENGVGLLPINEKAMAGSSEGGSIFIQGAGTLAEIITPLSTNYGSTWKESVIETNDYIYGVDSVARKIWRTNGRNFEIISDFKIQQFLNENITLDENEKTPMIGLRNIKTHYNGFKQDVMFTYYDTTRENVQVLWSICYNEQIQKWMTRFSWTPLASANINNVYFSFDREAGKKMSLIGYTLTDSPTAEGITLSAVDIESTTAGTIGTLSLKGYNYYSQYTQTFTIDSGDAPDNQYFAISGTTLSSLGFPDGFPKYSFVLKVRVGLSEMINDVLTEVQSFYDFISVHPNRSNLTDDQKIAYDLEYTTYFWKHGSAGIFDITTPILPTKWYDRQEVFEFEFIVVDNPSIHKIYDNLMLLANNATPDSFEFEVIGDVYNVTKSTALNSTNFDNSQQTFVTSSNINAYQKGKSIKQYGRMRGNMEYKEDIWDVEIKPYRFTVDTNVIKEARVRDKYCKIRVRYDGTQLAVITALKTMYTQSYA